MEDETETLTELFQHKLTREVISIVLCRIMESENLSVRGAAEKAGVSKGVLESVRYGRASIDKGLEILEALGCFHEVKFILKPPAPEAFE